jgi:type VI secretion system secreted protein VgrG
MPADTNPDSVAASLGETAGVRFDFSTSAPEQPEWLVRTVHIQESISESYALELELGAHAGAEHAAALLGKNASVRWQRDDTARVVHGVVSRVEPGTATERLSIVHITVVPALAALQHSSSSRIFAEQTIAQVVDSVFSEALTPFERKWRFDLPKADDPRGESDAGPGEPPKYPKREYVVQHRESDFAFVTRLLAEQGLWYYFEHPQEEGSTELLVIADATSRAKPVREDPELEVSRDRHTNAQHEAVTSFDPVDRMRPTSLFVRQYDWTHPELMQEREATVSDAAGLSLGWYEHGDVASYDYQEPRYAKHETDPQAQMRLDALRVQRTSVQGRSNVGCLRPGAFARVEGKEYLIVGVSHEGDCTSSADASSQRGRYSNTFWCVLRDNPYRPPRLAKPRIQGVQTAMVVDRKGGMTAPQSSGDGDDIVTDKHGRIRVKFHWDPTSADAGGTSSCWLRVAQSWAGQGWGFQFIPRVGMEVVVQFIDGDPDRPVVTGCLYNGLNPPPYADKPTQSGIKTASSVDPTRYNELRFEDAKGHEQIFVRAQKDYVEEVLHDHTTKVLGNQTLTVSKNQTEAIQGSASLAVGGDRSKAVTGNESIAVTGERRTKIEKKNTEVFQDEHELTVSKAVKETYKASHDRTVTGTQTFEAKADKIEHVVGSYELTTDKSFVLNQGGTKLTFEGDKVALDAAGAISVKRGAACIDIDASGNIAVKTSASISLEVGSNKILLSQSGIEITATQIDAKAGPSELALTPASATLTSVNTTIEAKATCSVKGTQLLNLNG